jgi:hypothetical protein
MGECQQPYWTNVQDPSNFRNHLEERVYKQQTTEAKSKRRLSAHLRKPRVIFRPRFSGYCKTAFRTTGVGGPGPKNPVRM